MSVRLDIDWVRDFAERRLSPPERVVFEARLRTEPELAELVDRYAEVKTWPAEPVDACAVRFEDLALDDGPPAALAPRRAAVRSLAIAAGILLAFTGGFFVVTRRVPTAPSPSGSVVLEAIPLPNVKGNAGVPWGVLSIPPLAETYLPVVDHRLRFVEGLADARGIARVAGRPALVFVHLDGCPACAEMERSTFRDERVLALAPGFVFAKVSATVVGSGLLMPPNLGLDEVKGWPMFAVFDADGHQIDAFGGILDAEGFAARLSRSSPPTATKPADWTPIREAARRLRLVDEATTEGEKFALLARIDSQRVSRALGLEVDRRRRNLGEAANGVLETVAAHASLDSEVGVEAALAEIDRAILRFSGSPVEADFRRVRDRLAADRKFPTLEYSR